MGHAPPRSATPPRLPTRLDHAKREFVRGHIDLTEFEARVEALLYAGAEDQPAIIDAGPGGFRLGKPENR